MKTDKNVALRARCASKAKTRLSAMHRADYDRLYDEECRKVGLEPTRNHGMGKEIVRLQEEVARLNALLTDKEQN